jgi:hypothetical protein
MSLGTIAIGTSTESHVVVSMTSDGGSTINTMISPAMARIYGAMLVALADQIDPPGLQETKNE